VEVMYQFDPGTARQWHADHTARMRADYLRAQRVKPEPRATRMNRRVRRAWVTSLNARAAGIMVVMVPIALVAVGVRAFI
jgi:hypothetical protein